MPMYSYKCTNCDVRITSYHGISEEEKIVDCEFCGAKNCMTRLPSNFSLDIKETEKKVGSVVNKSIEEFREDLKQEKQKLQNEFFEPDK